MMWYTPLGLRPGRLGVRNRPAESRDDPGLGFAPFRDGHLGPLGLVVMATLADIGGVAAQVVERGDKEGCQAFVFRLGIDQELTLQNFLGGRPPDGSVVTGNNR